MTNWRALGTSEGWVTLHPQAPAAGARGRGWAQPLTSPPSEIHGPALLFSLHGWSGRPGNPILERTQLGPRGGCGVGWSWARARVSGDWGPDQHQGLAGREARPAQGTSAECHLPHTQKTNEGASQPWKETTVEPQGTEYNRTDDGANRRAQDKQQTQRGPGNWPLHQRTWYTFPDFLNTPVEAELTELRRGAKEVVKTRTLLPFS